MTEKAAASKKDESKTEVNSRPGTPGFQDSTILLLKMRATPHATGMLPCVAWTAFLLLVFAQGLPDNAENPSPPDDVFK